jgi:hypothetical protein
MTLVFSILLTSIVAFNIVVAGHNRTFMIDTDDTDILRKLNIKPVLGAMNFSDT